MYYYFHHASVFAAMKDTRDECSSLISFFLRKVHREREQAFEVSIKLYQDASPGDMGVPLKLFPQDPDVLQGSCPYECAVQELKLLVQDCCPQRKLECIGEASFRPLMLKT